MDAESCCDRFAASPRVSRLLASRPGSSLIVGGGIGVVDTRCSVLGRGTGVSNGVLTGVGVVVVVTVPAPLARLEPGAGDVADRVVTED